jgi:peroxiredoxin
MPGRQPPNTEEGWFVSHLILSVDRLAAQRDGVNLADRAEDLSDVFEPAENQQIDLGRVVSSEGDLMTVMFAETLEAVESFQREVLHSPLGTYLEREYTFLSVTELSFYRSTEEKVSDHMEDTDLEPGTEAYKEKEKELEKRFQKYEDMRLHPEIPNKDYLTFYPMEKRRNVEQNWYQLPAEERSDMMQAHGAKGRKYAGDIKQIITSCVGLDEWEWGVTLYGDDPKDFKRLIYDMRFDEVSAVYSEFGPFYTGFRIDPEELPEYLS